MTLFVKRSTTEHIGSAGRKGRKDLARSLPGFKVLEELFLRKFPKLCCLQSRHVGYTNFGTCEFANSIS